MLIQMLMTASELIDMGVSSEQRRLEDAQTLVRVLCHKKDRTASKFLKRQYEFPMSSGKDRETGHDLNHLLLAFINNNFHHHHHTSRLQLF